MTDQRYKPRLGIQTVGWPGDSGFANPVFAAWLDSARRHYVAGYAVVRLGGIHQTDLDEVPRLRLRLSDLAMAGGEP